MLAWKYRILLATGTLGGAVWLGYSAERHVMDAAGSKPVTIQSVVRRAMAPKSRIEQIDRLNQLRHAAGRGYPSPRESAECWELIRGFSVDDVQAALAEIPEKPHRPVNESLIGMLFFRWGQMDPEAAARQSMTPQYAGSYSAIVSVATAWGDRDPEAALRWAASIDSNLARNTLSNVAGRTIAKRNPDDALKVLTEFPRAMNGVVGGLVEEASGTEEDRTKWISQLATLPDPRVLKQYLQQLVYARVYGNPEGADSFIAEMERAGLSEQDLADVRGIALSYARRSQPEKMAESMQSMASKATPEEQQNHFRNWAVSQPEQAAAWASQEGRADLVAEVVKKQSMGLLLSNWQPGVEGSSNSPWVKGVLSQYDAWRKLDPTAAAAWLQTMPTDIRNHLSQDHATR